MAKDKLYFSHDYNARNDKKIAALVRDYKSSGYGIFWATCEMMHEEGGDLEVDDLTYSALAKDLNEDFDLIKCVLENCIHKYKLFKINEYRLVSDRVGRNLDKRSDISEKRRKAAFAKHMHANAEQMDAVAMQNGAKKEIKKEIKKENRGVSFSADNRKVFFEDGSSQELGLEQQRSLRDGVLQPHYVKQGKIE
jgi:hypothetical protein